MSINKRGNTQLQRIQMLLFGEHGKTDTKISVQNEMVIKTPKKLSV